MQQRLILCATLLLGLAGCPASDDGSTGSDADASIDTPSAGELVATDVPQAENPAADPGAETSNPGAVEVLAEGNFRDRFAVANGKVWLLREYPTKELVTVPVTGGTPEVVDLGGLTTGTALYRAPSHLWVFASGLWKVPFDGSAPLRVTEAPPFCSLMAGNDTHAVCATAQDGTMVFPVGDHVASVATSSATGLRFEMDATYVYWSPDAKTLHRQEVLTGATPQVVATWSGNRSSLPVLDGDNAFLAHALYDVTTERGQVTRVSGLSSGAFQAQALAPFSGHLLEISGALGPSDFYFAMQGSPLDTILRVPLGGGAATVFAEVDDPRGMLVDGGWLYIVGDADPSPTQKRPAIFRIPL